MKENGVIQILRTFSRNELIEFDRFLRSPYFTEGKRVRSNKAHSLFKSLCRFHPEFNDMKLTKEKLFATIYPRKRYNDATFRKINSDLTFLTERFLIQRAMESNELDEKKYLTAEMKNRNLDDLFEKHYNALIKHIGDLRRDEEYYFESYKAWMKYYNFFYNKKNFRQLSVSADNVNNFSIFALISSLKIYLWALSFERMTNKEFDLILSEEILLYVGKNLKRFDPVPQLQLVYCLIMLIKTNKESYYRKVIRLKKDHLLHMSDIDKVNTFIMLTNYCNENILLGEEKLRTERFRLDKEFLQIIKRTEFKKPHVLYAIAAAKNANRLGKFSWAERMLTELVNEFTPEEYSFAVNFIKADKLFIRKDFNSALNHLSKINSPFGNQKQYVRNLQIQIFIEIEKYDTALSIIDSSRHFLKREKQLSESTRKNSENFLRLAERFIRVKNLHSPDKLFVLHKQIQETDHVFNKDWLLEKCRVQ